MLIHVAALERVRLVQLCQVVAELRGVAEAFADHPAIVAELTHRVVLAVRRTETQGGEAAVARDLLDAEDAISPRQVARVIAVRLQPVGMLAAQAEAPFVDQRVREHVRMARGQSVHPHLLVAFG